MKYGYYLAKRNKKRNSYKALKKNRFKAYYYKKIKRLWLQLNKV